MRLLLVSCLLFTITFLSAQKKKEDALPTNFDVAQIDVDFKKANVVRHYQDAEKRHYFIGSYQDNSSIETHIVQTDSSFKILNDVVRNGIYLHSLEGGYDFANEQKDKIISFQYYKGDNRISGSWDGVKLYSLDKKNLVVFESPFIQFPEKEHLIFSLNEDSLHYYVTLSSTKGRDSLFFYKINNDLKVERKAIDLTKLNVRNFQKVFESLAGFDYSQTELSKNTIFYKDKGKDRASCILDRHTYPNRAYLNGDKCLIVFNANEKLLPLKPQVLEIDLTNLTITKSKIIDLNLPEALNQDEFKLISTYYDDKIFNCYITAQSLEFDIREDKNFGLLKKYKCTFNDTSFLNNPPKLVAHYNKGYDYMMVKNHHDSISTVPFNTFLRQGLKKYLGIKVSKVNDNYDITVGSVEEIYKESNPPVNFNQSYVEVLTPIGFAMNAFKTSINSTTLEQNKEKKFEVESPYEAFFYNIVKKDFKIFSIGTLMNGSDSFAYYNNKTKKLIITADKS